jgi:hypothetical protein
VNGAASAQKGPSCSVLGKDSGFGSHDSVAVHGDQAVGGGIEPLLPREPTVGLRSRDVIQVLYLVHAPHVGDQGVDIAWRPGSPGQPGGARRRGEVRHHGRHSIRPVGAVERGCGNDRRRDPFGCCEYRQVVGIETA